MHIVVCYDVKKNKIRRKIRLKLIGARGKRIQKSVFELSINKDDLKKLQAELTRIKSNKDHIAYYTLCESCVQKTRYYGPKAGRQDFKSLSQVETV